MRIGLPPEKLNIKLKPDVLQLLSSLKTGQAVSARVISQDQEGQALLDMLGSRIRLDVGRPVKQGDQLVFEVVREHGGKDVPSLKLIDVKSQPALQASLDKGGSVFSKKEDSSPQVQSSSSMLQSSAVVQSAPGKEVAVKAVLSKLPAFLEKQISENRKVPEQAPAPVVIPARVVKGSDEKTTGRPEPVKIVFSVRGEEIQARVSSPIQEGKTVFLEKIKPGPSTEFRVIQPDMAKSVGNLAALVQSEGGAGAFPKLIGMMSRMLQNSKPSENGIRQLPEPRLEKLMQVMERISLKSEDPKIDFLENLIKGSGLAWEKKLGDSLIEQVGFQNQAKPEEDIKALILDLLSDAPSLSPEVGKTLESALSSIENLQMMNRISTSENGVFFLPFPILFDGSFSFGQVFFDLPDEKQAEEREKPFRVSVVLNMTELGKLKADISFLKKKISGTIVVSSEEVRGLFLDNISALEDSLIARGFEAADFTVRTPRISGEIDSSAVFSAMVEKKDGFNILV